MLSPYRSWVVAKNGLGVIVDERAFFGDTAEEADARATRYVATTPPAGTLGDATSTAEGIAQDEITAALQNAQLSPANIQSAITSYTGLGVDAQNAILNIVQGGPVTATSLAPLIAAGLAATGVGAPIVAAVAAALPIIDAIVGMFAPKPADCSWYIGAICYNGVQPYGPSDPTWRTWEQFIAGTNFTGVGYLPAGFPNPTNPNDPSGFSTAVLNDLLDGAFPWYRRTIGCELATYPQIANPTPLDQFCHAYNLAWQKNAEYEVNGYKSADDYALLTAVVNAWNAVHHNSSTYTIPALSPIGNSNQFCIADGNYTEGTGIRYVNMLLDGDVNGKRHPPVTIYTGPKISVTKIIPLHLGPPSKSTAVGAAAPSTAGKVARVGAVAAVAGTGVWVALGGRPMMLVDWARRALSF